MNKILVTGGTGLLGSEVVRQLIAHGKEAAILTSSGKPVTTPHTTVFQGNMITGKGLKEAVANADTIIHCASSPANFQETDIIGTKNLLNALDQDQMPHLIYISIAGIDSSIYPYYIAKKSVEDMIRESGIRFSILRTTQFHDFVLNLIHGFLATGENNVVIPDRMKFQSVAIGEVAAKLISISAEEPAGHLPEFAGPQILSFEDMFSAYLADFKSRVSWHTSQLQHPRYELFRSGINLFPDNALGEITWTEFLRKRP